MPMVEIIAIKNRVLSDIALNAAITIIVFRVRAMWTETADFSIQVHGALLGGKRTYDCKLTEINFMTFEFLTFINIHRHYTG